MSEFRKALQTVYDTLRNASRVAGIDYSIVIDHQAKLYNDNTETGVADGLAVVAEHVEDVLTQPEFVTVRIPFNWAAWRGSRDGAASTDGIAVNEACREAVAPWKKIIPPTTDSGLEVKP